TALIRSPSTATSPRNAGAPVPSTTVPPVITRSCATHTPSLVVLRVLQCSHPRRACPRCRSAGAATAAGHAQHVERPLQLVLGGEAFLEHDLAHGPAVANRGLRGSSGGLVPDDRDQRRHERRGRLRVPATHVLVRPDA